MKNPVSILARGLNRRGIRDIGNYDLEPPLFAMLLQIGLTADGKVVDNPHLPTFGNQPIDEVTADEARPTRNDI